MRPQTITIVIEPYEHADERRFAARVKRYVDRLSFPRDESFRSAKVMVNGETVEELSWGPWS